MFDRLGLAVRDLARSRAHGDRFHGAAFTLGGRENGAPGPRPRDTQTCHGAFVLDPDGHDFEAVSYTREP